ncbi:DUF2793 domain-containing protein [Peteryoungia algae]|uniref:DUF2793 domain-containing protein n=1 Tax=Peteryoungia algae TaxID=2919917 RepID=A0ABT0CYX2_9HYPH|nr:DUF2793 domain-containing protein [Rhizobium sp. SSM4.3]MCJ8238367.1 DUF2793 domain-containing protein [Rhizobium sp. SSM4.3]
MTDATANLDLPFILPAQAQKHVTHNEALQRLDALVQLVVATSAESPPADPAEGQIHWVTAPETGPWTGRAESLALFQDGVWVFIPPRQGWTAFFLDDARLKIFNGAEWIEQPLPTETQFERLGIAATPDSYNRLSLCSPASLFSHAGGSHRLTVNKSGIAETASLIFQSNWQGRAEMGLAGEDRFSLKVNGDVTGWRQAVSITPEGYVRHDQRPLVRASLAPATLTPAAGSFTGFDILHLSGGDIALGSPLPSGNGHPLVVPASGYYLLSLTVAAISIGSHKLHVSRNGSADILSHVGGAGTSSTMALVWLDVTDTVALRHEGTTQYEFGYGKTEISLALL